MINFHVNGSVEIRSERDNAKQWPLIQCSALKHALSLTLESVINIEGPRFGPAKQEHRGRIRVCWRRDLVDFRTGPTAAAAEGAVSCRGARRRVGASGGRGGSRAQGEI